jgi:hypothetical protein
MFHFPREQMQDLIAVGMKMSGIAMTDLDDDLAKSHGFRITQLPTHQPGYFSPIKFFYFHFFRMGDVHAQEFLPPFRTGWATCTFV